MAFGILTRKYLCLFEYINIYASTIVLVYELLQNITAAGSPASLEVTMPNPAKESTTIRYDIPFGTASARLTVVKTLGQVMKEEIISAGAGQVTLNVSNLASGTYLFTLWLNGQQNRWENSGDEPAEGKALWIDCSGSGNGPAKLGDGNTTVSRP